MRLLSRMPPHGARRVTSLGSIHPFEALRRRLRGEDIPAPDRPPAIARLFRVLEGEPRVSPLDLAVLFRHVLRREDGALWVPSVGNMPSAADWSAVGVDAIPSAGGFRIHARPWIPSWLPDVPADGVDGPAARGAARRREDRASADPYLNALNYPSYQSIGQRRALRAALSAPRGSTLVVSLPTGGGKSLVFHALARVGLGDGPGVTLVVTPTVALALDHEQSSRRRGFDQMPMAYRADEPERNQPLLDRIARGQQSLCFASPEAVCTALNQPLREAAGHGLLRAIIVDEAHLIDSWGISFRPDFQMLAGLRRTLLKLAGNRPFRTVLLSATVAGDSVALLRTLFPGEQFRIVSAARLRPEIEYWVASTSDQTTRDSRVIEALLHLPRPLILYTTTRADAARWYSDLRHLGFGRIGTVTGDTRDADRARVIEGWRAGVIDLVVGTSAFGLGIDNRDVRAVVHACVPESLDRFYQEVGRGGRDGRASVSLLLPSKPDIAVATRLSRRQLLTEEKAEHRWRAMFTHREHQVEFDTHVVPVNRRPGVDNREIDMVGPKNTAWNIRTLVLMAAAGGIQLLDVPQQLVRQANNAADFEDEDGEDGSMANGQLQVRLAIDDPMHLDKSFWDGRVADFRVLQKKTASRSFRQMRLFLRADRCAADIIAPLYEIPENAAQHLPEIRVARACGGCPSCRAAGNLPHDSEPYLTPHPWSPRAPDDPLQRLLTDNGQLLVFYRQRAVRPLSRIREREALQRIWACGVRNLILLDDTFEAEDFAESTNMPLFVARRLGPNGLPKGPTLIAASARDPLALYLFNERAPGEQRIWLLPESAPHPTRREVTLRQVPPRARVLSLSEFVSELGP